MHVLDETNNIHTSFTVWELFSFKQKIIWFLKNYITREALAYRNGHALACYDTIKAFNLNAKVLSFDVNTLYSDVPFWTVENPKTQFISVLGKYNKREFLNLTRLLGGFNA